jgi:hypothetical protein
MLLHLRKKISYFSPKYIYPSISSSFRLDGKNETLIKTEIDVGEREVGTDLYHESIKSE